MKRIPILIFALCLQSALANAADVAPTGTQYLIETKIISAPTSALGSNALTIISDAMKFSSNGQWSVVGTVLASGDWLKKLETMDGVDLLSAPRMTVRAGTDAKIEIVRQIAYMEPETNVIYRVQRHWFSGTAYMETMSNGLYRPKALEDDLNPGIQVEVNATPSGAVNTDVKLGFTYNLLVEMSELPGTHMKAGKPVIESRKFNTAVTVKLGDWIAIGGAQKVRREEDKREENIIVFLRVTEAK